MAISTLQGQKKWVELGTSTISGNPASVSFTSISTLYSDLLLSWNDILLNTSSDNVGIRINNDTGTNYSYVHNNGFGGYNVHSNGDYNRISLRAFLTNYPSSGYLLIEGANDIYKTITFNSIVDDATGNGAFYGVAQWFDATAINRLDFFPTNNTLKSGSLKLYGRN